jgi:ribosome maturation factor RimP
VIGQTVKLKLYKALDGKKEFVGELLDAKEKITLCIDGNKFDFDFKEISKANLCDF